MQVNTAVTNEPIFRQWICGCRGEPFYVNEHRWIAPLELKGKKHAAT